MTEAEQERFFARVRALTPEELRRRIDRDDEEMMARLREQSVRAASAAREQLVPDEAST
jgi:hypothetical protein